MDDFEQFKQLWQQQAIPTTRPDVAQLKQTNANHHRKLRRAQLWAAILLLLTPVGILWIGFFSQVRFQSTLTHVAVVLIALIPAVQGLVNLSTYVRLRRIDDTAPVVQHLAQWEQYYAFRQGLIRFNMPLYFILLNGAFGLYFIELLGYFSVTGRVVVLSLYTAWMLFAYFVLGSRSRRREQARLDAIISNLRTLQNQLANPG